MDGETEGATGAETTDDTDTTDPTDNGAELAESFDAHDKDETLDALLRILAHAEQHGEAYPGAVRDLELVRERIGQ